MRHQLQQGVDPKRLTRQHPWIAVGSAAVAGFVAGMVAIPSADDSALKRLERIERALHTSNGSADGAAPAPAAKPSRLLRIFARRLFKALRPTLLAALTSAFTARAAGAPDGAATDGEQVAVEDTVEERDEDFTGEDYVP